MDDSKSTTPAPAPAGTEDNSATQQPTAPPAATDDNDMVTISKEDYKKLQSQRDSNHERARKTEYQVALMAQERDIEKFISENKAKFPDVKTDDLLDAEDPEDFEKLAAQTQTRIDEAAQRRLGELQQAQVPKLSPKEKAEQLKQLKENPGSASFQKMLKLEQQQ